MKLHPSLSIPVVFILSAFYSFLVRPEFLLNVGSSAQLS
jgi:hypothetical protein